MKKLIIVIVIFMTCMITNSCLWTFDDESGYLDTKYCVINNSSDTIYWTLGITDDSTITNSKILSHLWEIIPNDSVVQYTNSDNLKTEYFLQVDIWKKSTIKKYTRDYIREHDIVDKRYILNYYDLEKMNFRIVYE